MISFSLHSPDEVISFYQQDGMDWTVKTFRITNPRWDQETNYHRSVAHTMIMAQKSPSSVNHSPLVLEGTLSEMEYQKLKQMSEEVWAYAYIIFFS